MNIKEAFELVDSYIDPVDNDVIEAVDIIKAEIERKDKVLENVIYTCEQYHGNATGLHMASEFLITNCRQALSEEV